MSIDDQNAQAPTPQDGEAPTSAPGETPLKRISKAAARVVFKKSDPTQRMIYTSYPNQNDLKLMQDPKNKWWPGQKAEHPNLFSDMGDLVILTLEERKCQEKEERQKLWRDWANKHEEIEEKIQEHLAANPQVPPGSNSTEEPPPSPDPGAAAAPRPADPTHQDVVEVTLWLNRRQIKKLSVALDEILS